VCVCVCFVCVCDRKFRSINLARVYIMHYTQDSKLCSACAYEYLILISPGRIELHKTLEGCKFFRPK